MQNKNSAYAIVMAGGRGERFWPQSRLSNPKQLLRLLGNLTLIEQTLERLTSIFDHDHIIVVTNTNYVGPIRSLLSYLPQCNIIGEPVGRDTAPCAAVAAAYVKSISPDPDPVLCFLPADHIIEDVGPFLEVVRDSLSVAESSSRIVMIGVKPTAPLTGYGYIRLGDKIQTPTSTAFCNAVGFQEKPSLAVAEASVADGQHKWNSGIFFMKRSVLEKAFSEFAPDIAHFMHTAAARFSASAAPELTDLYEKLQPISLDYAIMEKVSDLIVADAAFDWDDVGSWTSMRNQILPDENNNVVQGLHAGVDTNDCIIVGNSNHLIATVDVKDLVIVETEDATLICSARSAQRVKMLVHRLASEPELAKFV